MAEGVLPVANDTVWPTFQRLQRQKSAVVGAPPPGLGKVRLPRPPPRATAPSRRNMWSRWRAVRLGERAAWGRRKQAAGTVVPAGVSDVLESSAKKKQGGKSGTSCYYSTKLQILAYGCAGRVAHQFAHQVPTVVFGSLATFSSAAEPPPVCSTAGAARGNPIDGLNLGRRVLRGKLGSEPAMASG